MMNDIEKMIHLTYGEQSVQFVDWFPSFRASKKAKSDWYPSIIEGMTFLPFPCSALIRGIYCSEKDSPNKKKGHVELFVLHKQYLSVDTWVLANEHKRKIRNEKTGKEEDWEISGLSNPIYVPTQVHWYLTVTSGCSIYLRCTLIRPAQ